MHFSYTNQDGIFTINAGFREDHGDRRLGERVQGDRTKLELVQDQVSFGLQLKTVNPDHFALAACLIFLPFIGNKVSFSAPVSSAIADFLASPGMRQNVGRNIEIVTKVERRAAPLIEPTLNTSALALGGGFDAVAVKTLLPEVFTYHQVPTFAQNHVYLYPAYRFYARRDEISFGGRPVCDAYIWSTVENIVRPRGVTTWATYALPALLIAEDRGLNCLLSGTVFEGSFCNNGIKFHDFGKGSGGFITEAFRAVGIEIAPAATMMPEYLNTVQVFESGLGELVSHCIMQPEGGPCGKCMKCYRKRMLYEVAKEETGVRVAQFEAQRFDQFDTPFIRRKSSEKPLYLSSSFRWLWDRLSHEAFIPALADAVQGIPGTGFDLGRMYPPGFALLPERIRSVYEKRCQARYDTMSDAEIEAVGQWDVTKPSAV